LNGIQLNAIQLLHFNGDVPDKYLNHSFGHNYDQVGLHVDLAMDFSLAEAVKASFGLEATADVVTSSPPPSPPSSFFIELLAPGKISADYIANLEDDMFPRWVKKHGLRKARWLWYSACVGIVFRQFAATVIEGVARYSKIRNG
jgi:hypothetical protein